MSVVFVNKHYLGSRKHCSNEQLLREFDGELFGQCAMSISAWPSVIEARALFCVDGGDSIEPILSRKALMGPML